MISHQLKKRPVGDPPELPDFLVMGVLAAKGRAHGYEVFHFLSEELEVVCSLGQSQTYAALSRLEAKGLAVHERIDQLNLPARKVFRLTPEGNAMFSHWANRPEPSVRNLRVSFLAKLFFASMEGRDAALRLIHAQLSECRAAAERLERLRTRARGVIARRALDYRIAVARAADNWLAGLREECEKENTNEREKPMR